MREEKRGVVCTAKNCKNKSYSSGKKSFFRFPVDPVRARMWLISCHREDLSHLEVEKLYKAYRLCQDHFQQKMFTNKFCNRLIENAVPTIFPTLEGYSLRWDHNYSRPKMVVNDEGPPPAKKIRILQNIRTACKKTETQDTSLSTGEIGPPSAKEVRILQDILTGSKIETQDTPLSTRKNEPPPNKNMQILKDILTGHKKTETEDTHLSTRKSQRPLQIETILPDEDLLEPPSLVSPASSTQSSSSLCLNTPANEECHEGNIRILYRENMLLKKQVATLEKDQANFVNNINLKQYQQLTFKFCPEKIATCINIQVNNQIQKHLIGRRYSDEFKTECLGLYFTDPKLYKNYLVEKFCVPRPQTLLKQIQGVIRMDCGLENLEVFKILKSKVNCFKEENKFCVLCIDEMSIKAHLFYNRATDAIVGLAVNENGEKNFKPAQSACVLMVRGIYSKWKQPLAYYFSHSTCPANSLQFIVKEAIEKLHSVGLKVCAVTSDMGFNNLQLTQLLGVTAEKPQFEVDNEKICYLFDAPQILKAIRNVLIKYDIFIDGQIISWKFIKQFYEHDKNYPIRAASKLTDSHIDPSGLEKLKVKLASHVFSATVSTSMNLYIRFGHLPSEAAKTSEFIDRIDKLFDILNSSQACAAKKFNRAFKGLPFQIDFLNDCLDFIDALEIKDRVGNNVKNKIRCFNALKMTIKSIMSLWDYLKLNNYDYLLTRRLNRDVLENHFSIIRQKNGNCVNPTPVQFQRTFRKLQCFNLLHSGTENCEADLDPILLKFKNIPSTEDACSLCCMENYSTEAQIIADYQKLNSLETNFSRHICEYLFKKCLEVHSCKICVNYSKDHRELDDFSMFCFLKVYKNTQGDFLGNLKMPQNDFVKLITNIEIIFQKYFEEFLTKSNVCNNYMKVCDNVDYVHPCAQFPKHFLMKLYIRVRLYYTLNNINRKFKKTNKNKLIIWRN